MEQSAFKQVKFKRKQIKWPPVNASTHNDTSLENANKVETVSEKVIESEDKQFDKIEITNRREDIINKESNFKNDTNKTDDFETEDRKNESIKNDNNLNGERNPSAKIDSVDVMTENVASKSRNIQKIENSKSQRHLVYSSKVETRNETKKKSIDAKVGPKTLKKPEKHPIPSPPTSSIVSPMKPSSIESTPNANINSSPFVISSWISKKNIQPQNHANLPRQFDEAKPPMSEISIEKTAQVPPAPQSSEVLPNSLTIEHFERTAHVPSIPPSAQEKLTSSLAAEHLEPTIQVSPTPPAAEILPISLTTERPEQTLQVTPISQPSLASKIISNCSTIEQSVQVSPTSSVPEIIPNLSPTEQLEQTAQVPPIPPPPQVSEKISGSLVPIQLEQTVQVLPTPSEPEIITDLSPTEQLKRTAQVPSTSPSPRASEKISSSLVKDQVPPTPSEPEIIPNLLSIEQLERTAQVLPTPLPPQVSKKMSSSLAVEQKNQVPPTPSAPEIISNLLPTEQLERTVQVPPTPPMPRISEKISSSLVTEQKNQVPPTRPPPLVSKIIPNSSAVQETAAVPFIPPPPPPLTPSLSLQSSQSSSLPVERSSTIVFHGPPPRPPPPVLPQTLIDSQVNQSTSFTVPLRRENPVSSLGQMKPLFWTKINFVEFNDDVRRSLWTEIDEVTLPNIEEFAKLFHQPQDLKNKKKKTLKLPPKIEILDNNRSKSVGILTRILRNRNIRFSDIKHALREFDTSKVNYDLLVQIYDVKPTQKEITNILNFIKTNSRNLLGESEIFLLKLYALDMYDERMHCLVFKENIQGAILGIKNNLDTLEKVCEFFTTNTNLKTIFSIILTLGNYMNCGNQQRGEACAFELDILSKLKTVKSTTGEMSLLRFIIEVYASQFEDVVNAVFPLPDPVDISKASAVSFEDIEKDLEEWQKQYDDVTNCVTEIIDHEESEVNQQAFIEIMAPILQIAEDNLPVERMHFDECKRKFKSTLGFFQFKSKNSQANDCVNEFFDLWLQFCSDFKKTWDEKFSK